MDPGIQQLHNSDQSLLDFL